MRALLLAAGIGSRLRPITDTIPKCLMPIHGRPLLAYWLDLLFTGGIERVLINTHHLAQQVRDFVGGSPWRDRVDLVHEAQLLGTGGTLVANHDYFDQEPAVVAHADNLTDLDIRSLIAAHASRPPGCCMTMLAFETDDPRSCGILEADEDGILRAFHEKLQDPPGTLANAAVYILEREVADYGLSLEASVFDLQTRIIPHFLGRIFVVRHAGYHRDIGSPGSLERAHREFGQPQRLVPPRGRP
jgi:mannose-1-phosphate guanylyltransferase